MATMLMIASIPAHADVLEIGASGEVVWLTGGSELVPATGSAAPLAEVPLEAGIVPDHAVAMLAGRAGIVPQLYAAKVAELAQRYDLSPTLIEALVWQESRWRADARSPVGARGLAQLMPGTARDLGVNPDDPFANLEGGARYLREQIDRFGGDIERALAAYNAGPGRVERAGGIPRIRETQSYVSSIMSRLSDHSRSEP
ncbi:lytic transglycosylase domain-containing protein [Croceibacterium ferulae]|uniref:lytic transglycosylase domain-containing protein n=1 Tax=Croceibacterium ferulae TaxID=1854641 RepID=UPI001F4D5646|nr:lytic transglycosylase domain-containing protein [Croceibacterium ferulae]